MSLLTEGDKKFLPMMKREAGQFHLGTQWYLRDWTPLPFQWAWHQLDIVNTSFVAGIAAGKTAAVAASNLMDCISTPYFRALNTSVTAKQAELPFEMAMGWIEGNPRLEHLIDDMSLRPFPALTFKNFSEWEFRTAGTDARFIRGSEYDRINLDEAGLDLAGNIIKVLRGRLRGIRPDGTMRMARLDVTSSPSAALWLRERFYRGWPEDPTSDLGQYRSLRASTYDNTHLSPTQIRAMEAEFPPDMIAVELGGQFPEFGMSMFPSVHIEACIDIAAYDEIYSAINPENGKAEQGYRLEEDPRHGIILLDKPREAGHVYISAGDPGTDNYPKRNAAVVMVADVTDIPHKLVYFNWLAGKGSYEPFLRSYHYAVQKFIPVLKGIDATGPQQALNELGFEREGIETDKLSFTTDKSAMLNALSWKSVV